MVHFVSAHRAATRWLAAAAVLLLLASPAPTALAEAGAPATANPQTTFDRHGVRQADGFVFTAAQGPLSLKMQIADGGSFLAMVEGPEPGEFQLSEVLEAGDGEVVAQLPAAGTYTLVISPLLVEEPAPDRLIELSATDLEMPGLTAPAITAREMSLFEEVEEPFDLEAGIQAPDTASSLSVLLDGETLHENLLQADGSATPVQIDPTTLEDGVHQLLLVATSSDSENTGALMRAFFIDREDSFSDVPRSHWARKPIEILSGEGVLNGTGNGLYEPGRPVTRAEFAKMIATMFPMEDDLAVPAFADLPESHWASPYVEQLAGRGLLKGEVVDGATYFRPDRTISRAEAATILGRIMGVAELDLSTAGLEPADYQLPDLDQVPDWARPSVLILRKMGWITGFPDGTFRPAQILNRDQAAKILLGFLIQ